MLSNVPPFALLNLRLADKSDMERCRQILTTCEPTLVGDPDIDELLEALFCVDGAHGLSELGDDAIAGLELVLTSPQSSQREDENTKFERAMIALAYVYLYATRQAACEIPLVAAVKWLIMACEPMGCEAMQELSLTLRICAGFTQRSGTNLFNKLSLCASLKADFMTLDRILDIAIRAGMLLDDIVRDLILSTNGSDGGQYAREMRHVVEERYRILCGRTL